MTQPFISISVLDLLALGPLALDPLAFDPLALDPLALDPLARDPPPYISISCTIHPMSFISFGFNLVLHSMTCSGAWAGA